MHLINNILNHLLPSEIVLIEFQTHLRHSLGGCHSIIILWRVKPLYDQFEYRFLAVLHKIWNKFSQEWMSFSAESLQSMVVQLESINVYYWVRTRYQILCLKHILRKVLCNFIDVYAYHIVELSREIDQHFYQSNDSFRKFSQNLHLKTHTLCI